MNWKIVVLSLLMAFLIILYFNSNKVKTSVFLGDLHMHTTCSDGKNSYEEMVQAAVENKLSFIAITDHKMCSDVISKCLAETKIICIPGQEVTTGRTHLLAININKNIDPNLSLQKQVEEIHNQGGIAIAAHPNREDNNYTESELIDSKIDAMECTGDVSERRSLPCVYDSDAHNIEDVAWQYNSCNLSILNASELKNAIIKGECHRAVKFASFSTYNTDTNY